MLLEQPKSCRWCGSSGSSLSKHILIHTSRSRALQANICVTKGRRASAATIGSLMGCQQRTSSGISSICFSSSCNLVTRQVGWIILITSIVHVNAKFESLHVPRFASTRKAAESTSSTNAATIKLERFIL